MYTDADLPAVQNAAVNVLLARSSLASVTTLLTDNVQVCSRFGLLNIYTVAQKIGYQVFVVSASTVARKIIMVF